MKKLDVSQNSNGPAKGSELDPFAGTSRSSILIAEDTPIQAKKLKYDLEKLGFNVTWAKDGTEALAILQENPSKFDVVISDYEMPKMNGLELLCAIRADERMLRLPVIVLTTVSELPVIESAIDNNVSDFMVKPYNPIILKLRVATLIKLSEYEQILAGENAALTSELVAKNALLEDQNWNLQQANLDLVNLQNELLVASKSASLGVLSNGIAHEINNPLAIIKSYADQLGEIAAEGDVEAARAKNISGKIDKSVQRVAKIVQSMQSLSASSQETGLRIDIEIDQVLAELRSFFEEYAQRLGIEVVYDLKAQFKTIVGREGLLQQAFLNLIYNALDSMASMEVRRLTISTRAEADKLIVSILDTGCGIPTCNMAKIFDPFFTTKEPGKGMGLGLSLVYRFVKDSGGEICCHSNCEGEARGTRFDITFKTIPA